MRKQFLVVAVIVFLILVGGFVASEMNQDKSSEEQLNARMPSDAGLVSDENPKSDDQTVKRSDEAVSSLGTYITLSDFNADTQKYSTTRIVYFFHASWCPNCQAIHKDLTNDDSKIPANVTIIKTDFDTETDLRKRYGVTTQYTFVEVDRDGNEIKQWSAPSIEDVYAGL